MRSKWGAHMHRNWWNHGFLWWRHQFMCTETDDVINLLYCCMYSYLLLFCHNGEHEVFTVYTLEPSHLLKEIENIENCARATLWYSIVYDSYISSKGLSLKSEKLFKHFLTCRHNLYAHTLVIKSTHDWAEVHISPGVIVFVFYDKKWNVFGF